MKRLRDDPTTVSSSLARLGLKYRIGEILADATLEAKRPPRRQNKRQVRAGRGES